ncbi:hypothetical protein [Loktanella sp. M215]|nr:hypothetical protein [Loktanella sp. M215]
MKFVMMAAVLVAATACAKKPEPMEPMMVAPVQEPVYDTTSK